MGNSGQLKMKIYIKGTITSLTGLHIGGTNVGFAIGGADATVVRNPWNQQPFIPGSSLKGKMRSLLERLEGKWSTSGITQSGPYIGDKESTSSSGKFICDIFGVTPENIKENAKKKHGDYKPERDDMPISRIIVRDCELEPESVEKLKKIKSDMPYTEVKTEVVIDRITASATPRQLERVPAGAVFNMRIVLNVFDGDDYTELVNKIFEALCLVQNDALGGKGSRGSGEVAIHVGSVRAKSKADFDANKDWQEFKIEIPPQLRHEPSALA